MKTVKLNLDFAIILFLCQFIVHFISFIKIRTDNLVSQVFRKLPVQDTGLVFVSQKDIISFLATTSIAFNLLLHFHCLIFILQNLFPNDVADSAQNFINIVLKCIFLTVKVLYDLFHLS